MPRSRSKPVLEQVRWRRTHFENGLAKYSLMGWSAFADFLDAQVFTNRGRAGHRFIWRGQRRPEWPLMSSLDRLFQRLEYKGDTQGAQPVSLEERSLRHLKDFKYAARGRRGLHPAELSTENDWWALGQHFGLATPLLDWSHSPFAAAYFAFEEHDTSTSSRVVYGLDQDAVLRRNQHIIEENATEGRSAVLEVIEPLSDENPRLVSQGAMFTRAPLGVPIETWVQSYFSGSKHPVLLRIELPDNDRAHCLRALDRMNINHLSLFPDLTGASRATNLRTELDLAL